MDTFMNDNPELTFLFFLLTLYFAVSLSLFIFDWHTKTARCFLAENFKKKRKIYKKWGTMITKYCSKKVEPMSSDSEPSESSEECSTTSSCGNTLNDLS